jgi:hypothetical protein
MRFFAWIVSRNYQIRNVPIVILKLHITHQLHTYKKHIYI